MQLILKPETTILHYDVNTSCSRINPALYSDNLVLLCLMIYMCFVQERVIITLVSRGRFKVIGNLTICWITYLFQQQRNRQGAALLALCNGTPQRANNTEMVSMSCRDYVLLDHFPDSKVHGTNVGAPWVLSAPDGPHVGPMNLAIRVSFGVPWTKISITVTL